MTTTWTLGVLCAGAENVHYLTGGREATRTRALEVASGALVVAAIDRRRQEYRISMADTQIVIRPALTEHGDVDLLDLVSALHEVDESIYQA